jgi:hypothetical protein
MDGAGATVGETDELGALEAPVGLAEEQSQDTLLHWGEEGVGEAAGRARSHFGNDHT